MKHDDPFTLTERYPQVAQQAIIGKFQVWQAIEKLAAEGEVEQVDMTIQIVRAVPEDESFLT